MAPALLSESGAAECSSHANIKVTSTDQVSEDLIDVVERDPVETFQNAQDLIRVETWMFTLNMEPSRFPAHRSDRLRVSSAHSTLVAASHEDALGRSQLPFEDHGNSHDSK